VYRSRPKFHAGDWASQPIRHDLPKFVQLHFPINNGTKYLFPMMGANGYEINACRGIIMSFETNGITMMFIGIVWHRKRLFILIYFIVLWQQN
jgi:hypothetical protein